MHPTTQEILHLFRKHGHIEYGEGFSVLAHSFQAGLLAREQKLGHELIIAAFLHDIGHLWPLELQEQAFERMGEYGIEQHDLWGEKFVKERGFSDKIVATVKNHVASKRYLCVAEPGYYDQLSDASKMTLSYQGGPMSDQEAKAFKDAPYFEESILIRRIDELAKDSSFQPQSEHWQLLEDVLEEMCVS